MKSTISLLLVFVALLAACQSATPSVVPSPTSNEMILVATSTPVQAEPPSQQYPPPGTTSNNSGYPEPLPSIAYPSPQQSPTKSTNETQTPTTISWEDAQNQILNGQVSKIIQHKDLTVTLTLKDGTVVTTTEPKLDDVIHLIEQCGDKCTDIDVSTE
jgi:hypothetical protein